MEDKALRVARDQLKSIVRFAYSLVAARRVRAFVRSGPTVSECLSFIRRSSPRLDCGYRIIQVDSEIAELCARLAAEPPRRVLEIGTAGGGTLLLLAAVSRPDATLVSVDLPRPHGYAGHRERIYRAGARPEQELHLVRSDSHGPATAREVAALFSGEQVDFLLIDGDHSRDGVADDYAKYSPLVRPGGTIAFHDIVEGRPEYVGGVPEFWRELKAQLGDRAEEIVADRSQGGLGIGVVRAEG